MKKLKFLLIAICISAGIAGITNANASASANVPLCIPSPGDVCFGIPDEGGPIGWYANYVQYNP